MKTNSSLPDFNHLKSLLDLTSLEGTDSIQSITQLCHLGIENNVAAICTYPKFIPCVKKVISGTPLKAAAVCGYFPSGQAPWYVKYAELQFVLDSGVDEIDWVFSRGDFLAGNFNAIEDELMQCREISKGKMLKVILETSELISEKAIFDASLMALKCGADYIKTSTGKSGEGANLQVVRFMLNAIENYRNQFGELKGIKISGGIAEPENAWEFVLLHKKYFPEIEIGKTNFRIGAAKLLRAIIKQSNQI